VLLDAAAEMVAAGRIEDVSMETVAVRAGVSRALLYKHFGNRGELLAAVYEREAAHLHATLAASVRAADSLEEMLRALVEGALAAQGARGATFAALTLAGGKGDAQRAQQRRRDAGTLRYFARQAAGELGLDEAVATDGLRLALSSIAVVLDVWRARPTPENATRLADTYVTMTLGGLAALAGHRR